MKFALIGYIAFQIICGPLVIKYVTLPAIHALAQQIALSK